MSVVSWAWSIFKQEAAFLKMKDILAQETMLTYPEFDKPFVIYTDASELQIGGVVTQNDKPLGFFSKKLNDTQKRYPVPEQELLAIAETLKYFKHMLLGHKIVVRTDNKNLTYPNSTHTSDRVLRQRLLLEEYGVDIEYIQGAKNVVADALSRLPTAELFALSDEDEFPLNLALIAEQQLDDEALQNALASNKQPGYKKNEREHRAVRPCATGDNIRTCFAARIPPAVVPFNLAAPRRQTHAGYHTRAFLLARNRCGCRVTSAHMRHMSEV